ncbi:MULTISPECIES: hypothetical protein [Methylobacterium]|uniref:hypothetical protein n=1 Tax=Methylobacterium TaxID=407 RepID=UPI001650527C|nr:MULTISPECIES: hypothetical protein [Methylobacterium]
MAAPNLRSFRPPSHRACQSAYQTIDGEAAVLPTRIDRSVVRVMRLAWVGDPSIETPGTVYRLQTSG